MEIPDVLDDNGVLTGKQADKKEIRKHGWFQRGVICCFISDNAVIRGGGNPFNATAFSPKRQVS